MPDDIATTTDDMVGMLNSVNNASLSMLFMCKEILGAARLKSHKVGQHVHSRTTELSQALSCRFHALSAKGVWHKAAEAIEAIAHRAEVWWHSGHMWVTVTAPERLRGMAKKLRAMIASTPSRLRQELQHLHGDMVRFREEAGPRFEQLQRELQNVLCDLLQLQELLIDRFEQLQLEHDAPASVQLFVKVCTKLATNRIRAAKDCLNEQAAHVTAHGAVLVRAGRICIERLAAKDK